MSNDADSVTVVFDRARAAIADAHQLSSEISQVVRQCRAYCSDRAARIEAGPSHQEVTSSDCGSCAHGARTEDCGSPRDGAHQNSAAHPSKVENVAAKLADLKLAHEATLECSASVVAIPAPCPR
jgi:hypothetical protein